MDLKRFTRQIEDMDNRYVYYNGRKCELTYFPEDKFCSLKYVHDQKAPHFAPISDTGVRMKIDILYKEYLSGTFRF